MNEFLKIEYEQCLKLIVYYDERHQSLVKYAAGLSSGVPSILLAIWNLGGGANQYFWQFATLISGVTAISLLSIFTVLTQTRLYFVYPARQVNAIRKLLLQSIVPEFSENQMYTDTNFNAFKWFSTQTVLNLFVALQIGAFFGLTIFCCMFSLMTAKYLILVSLLLAVIITVTVFSLSAWYLYKKSSHHPDISIHNINRII